MVEIHQGTEAIWQILEAVKDPEIPVLTVVDLGIIRDVHFEDGKLVVTITPTYSGCPAMKTIETEIQETLFDNGYNDLEIKTTLSPAWTTDWLSEDGKKKLRAYGIAPPVKGSEDKSALFPEDKKIGCPLCNSTNTKMVSQFGSTPCKSLYKCLDCLEPFDYFKCH